MSNHEIFLENISNLMKTKGENTISLAKGLGIKQPSVFVFVQGKTKPSFDTLIKIADYFNVSLDYLVGRTDNPEVNL